MEIIRTEITKRKARLYSVTLEIGDKRPIEDSTENISLTVLISTEDDNPMMREVQGEALSRALEILGQQSKATKVS